MLSAVEWHIVVLGDVAQTESYQALAGATGASAMRSIDRIIYTWVLQLSLTLPAFDLPRETEGGTFLSIREFDDEHPEAARFLDAIGASSEGEGHEARRVRQQRYLEQTSRGDAERVEWFKALPPSSAERQRK